MSSDYQQLQKTCSRQAGSCRDSQNKLLGELELKVSFSLLVGQHLHHFTYSTVFASHQHRNHLHVQFTSGWCGSMSPSQENDDVEWAVP